MASGRFSGRACRSDYETIAYLSLAQRKVIHNTSGGNAECDKRSEVDQAIR